MTATMIPPRQTARTIVPHPRRRKLSRAAFYIHLWLGVLSTIALIAIVVTGILLIGRVGLWVKRDAITAFRASSVAPQAR